MIFPEPMPILQRHALDHPEVTDREPIRLLLGATASAYLTEMGEEAFVVIGKASSPDAGRYAIHLIPCSVKQADSAVRVARGLSAERKTKPTTP